MKVILSLFLLTLVLVLAEHPHSTPVNDPQLIDRINNNEHLGWKAKHYDQFEGKSIGEMASVLGLLTEPAIDPTIPREVNKPQQSRLTIPTAFDARTNWPQCVFPIRNQASCGSCWAFSTTSTLAHVTCIATNNSTKKVLSPDYLVRCDKRELGCSGGYMSYTWAFLKSNGTTTDTCVPYTSGSGVVAACPAKCVDNSTLTFTKAKSVTLMSAVTSIKTAIMTYGSVQASFAVYRDFYNYKSGVYMQNSTTFVGGHAVQLMGWGTESGKDFWLAANSWGNSWGLSGYFKIGQTQCGISSSVYSAQAVV